jgi:glycosyltransferase involved in cell wall biosynthesis
VSGTRVLAITSEPPWPLNSGGHIRTFHLMQALAAATQLRLVCPVQPAQAGAIAEIRAAGINVTGVPVGPRTPQGEAGRLLSAVVSGEPYVMYRRHSWRAAKRIWCAEIQREPPDVVYLDHLDSVLYSPGGSGQNGNVCPSVIDLHNRYSLLVRRASDEEPNPLKRAFLRREARLLMAMERRAARCCDAVLAVSDLEAEYFRGLGATVVHTVPNGVDCAAFADLPCGRAGEPTVLFLGTMSWGPNAAAARFLARDVLPALSQRVPHIRLLIVGRDPPRDLLALDGQDGIEVTGGVTDIKPYLRRASVLAVPLDAGGGTRLKILEAFAAGLPVVTTAVGAEGIAAEAGTHFVLSERLTFADAVADLLIKPATGERLAEAARRLAAKVYDWRTIGALPAAVVQNLAARGPRQC